MAMAFVNYLWQSTVIVLLWLLTRSLRNHLCTTGVGGPNLKQRVVRIMTSRVVRSLRSHRKLLLAAGLAVIATPVFIGMMQIERADAQVVPAKAPAAYDVISIRPHRPGNGGMSIGDNNGSLRAVNVSLLNLFENAYGIRQGLIFGLPKWAEDARWDIQAKVLNAPDDALKNLTDAQCRTLLVSMLADRFHIRTHLETKQLSVYDLVIAKNGPRFTQSAVENADEIKGVGGSGMSSGWNDKYHYIYCHDCDLASAAWTLSSFLDRNVIDKTGLTGNYSFALKYSQQNVAGTPGGDSADSYPSIFSALEDQVGLKLVPSKGPVTTLVIDHAEEPTPN
jgi:bla regulator protein BlaR1